MSQMIDGRIITEGFLKRDEKTLETALLQYKHYGISIALNILGNPEDAEECYNDALYAAWNSIPPQYPENFKAYLGKLTRETALDRYRKDRAKKRISPEAVSPYDELKEIAGNDSAEDTLMEKELAAQISSFLRSVKERDRILFVRRYWYYDSIAVLSENFGLKESHVKMILKRTRDRLKEHLIKEGYEL